ncbi:titin isoform X2 [Trichoplusia ni]|uniref:protein kinase C n=1 Tax=Trichoplusia ni TaxID=7111 RepID=A0A7E5VMN7_TRINI|nr:titin isoform X2 [Trichoplusia ni]
MPLFSEHIANMYYGSSSPYTGLPYSYSSSSVPSLGSSYSAPYLNPGSSYSGHSSLGSYSRAPLSSRWITSSGRNYSPMLTTISERGSASPIRINSPRRIAISSRTYGTPTYTPRPVNINTADIDVSRDRYRNRVEPSKPEAPTPEPPKPEPSKPDTSKADAPKPPETEDENGPFMPRVDGKPETGIDSSPGIQRSTIKRGRTVVRLYTVKRNSPRKPADELQSADSTQNQETETNIVEDAKIEEKENLKWREKLSDDLMYKDKREKKTLGAKLVEKFHVGERETESPTRVKKKETDVSQSLPATPLDHLNVTENKFSDRRCSMELLAEQANLLDSLIRGENLSTATLDLSKVGVVTEGKTKNETRGSVKRRSQENSQNPLKTTKSDHSLHNTLNSYKDVRDPRSNSKRRSIKKSSSGSCLRRLDSITEFPKEIINVDLPAIEEKETRLPEKQENIAQKPKPKLKTKITTSVEVSSAPLSPLKFKVENITVEEKPKIQKKEIIYSSEVVEISLKSPKIPQKVTEENKEISNIKKKINVGNIVESPEPEDGNFWNKIGKRETVYLMKRKQNLEEVKEKNKRALFWFPEEEEEKAITEHLETDPAKSLESNSNADITIAGANAKLDSNLSDEPIIQNKSEDLATAHENILPFLPKPECIEETKVVKESNVPNDSEAQNKANVDKGVPTIIPEVKPFVIKETNVDVAKESREDSKEVRICPECKKIGKSASLESVDENKVKKQSQKKTKSEKAKKIVKSSKSSDTKPPTPLLPKPSTQTNVFKKPESPTVTQGVIQTKLSQQSESKMVDEKKEVIKDSCVVSPKIEAEVEILAQSPVNKPEESTKQTKDSSGELQQKKVADVPPSDKLATPKTTLISTDTSNILEQKDVKYNKPAVCDNSNIPQVDKTDAKVLNTSTNPPVENKETLSNNVPISAINNATDKTVVSKATNLNNNNKLQVKSSPESKSKPIAQVKNDKTDERVIKQTITPLMNEQPSTSSGATTSKPAILGINSPNVVLQKTASSSNDCNSLEITKPNDLDTKEVILSLDIPNKEIEVKIELAVPIEAKTGEENKAENIIQKDALPETSQEVMPTVSKSPKKPVKEEKAARPLIATPRPLQKKAPQVIHSSDSSDTSSEEESSDEEDDETDASEDSAEFYECDNNTDGRTSTGSNDSGFDSSAPASPATFSQIKKEQSTAYDIFKKTGRFTPPARSIPRFRKYTVEDFQFIKVLGKGSFGKVLLAELRDTEYYYAVKCLKKDVVLEDDDVECTLIERKVLALGTNHPYLCHLFATFQTDSHLFFVMEYLNGGDLMFHIQQSGRFPELRARFYAAEIVSGLKFLHKRGIVYRDLKLDNILLDFEGHVRIADFGMCKLQIYLDKTADTFCGTPDYMAPEIIKGLKYNQTVDWWSFGVLLYEMLIGQSPFSGCDEDELFWSICNEMPSYPRFLSQEALTILTRLLDKDARTRLGGTECMHGEIRDQDFFHPIHWDRLERRELEAPFRPRVRHPMDTQYFDRAFTGERPRLTAVEPHVLRSMDQEPFRGFSYTNPNTTDR